MGEIDTKDILTVLQSHWKKLAIVAAAAIIISAFISSPIFIKPKYKSIAVIYPTNLMPFSQESNTEQLLQFLTSEEIKDNLTKRFDLFKHYEIDSTGERAFSKFNTYYHDNIKANSTLYESIEIEVVDESPVFAQKLASGLIEEADKLVADLKKQKVREYITSYSNQLKIKKNEIDSIEAKLKYMRMTFGLLDFKSQAKVMSKRMGGKRSLSEEEKTLMKGLKEYGGEYILLQEQLGVETGSYRELKMNYDKNLLDMNGHLSYSTVVSKPNLPDKKCAPLRAAIVIIFTFSALLLASVIILISHKKQSKLA
jgi:capsule polysaccharide export protein KpsE/RkpR